LGFIGTLYVFFRMKVVAARTTSEKVIEIIEGVDTPIRMPWSAYDPLAHI
jgi:hypothetical protein